MTSPTIIDGTVQSVQSVTLGDELSADAASGATSLIVDDAIDFDPDGGNLVINGQAIAYTAADDATGTITLAVGLTAGATAGDRVDLTDAAGVLLKELRASVELAEPVDNDEALDVPVAHSLWPLLAEGIRDPGTGESVRLTLQNDEWVLTDVIARPPQIDGALIAPATITPAALSFTAGGTTVTIDSVAPTGPSVGDLWLDSTDDYTIKQWDGAAWTPIQFGTNAIAASAIDLTKISFTSRDIGGIQTTIATTAPGSPLVGDLWLDSSSNYQIKRWDGASWVAVQFGANAIAPASLDSSKVSFTAHDIGGVSVTLAASAPSSPHTGDLWYDSTNGYQLKQWSGTAWTAYQYGTNAIAAGAVTAALIAAHTITATQIAAGTITASEIAADTITAAQIAANAITSSELSANSVTAAKIVANTITAAQLAAGTITANEIAANTITAAKIAANTITATQIAAGTITATELAANSVTASQIAANAVTAVKLAAGIIVAGIVDGTTITGAQIIAHGTAGEILVYNGTPAAGNLILAVSGASGTDAFGNAYTPGITLPVRTGTQANIFWPINPGDQPAHIIASSVSSTASELILSGPGSGTNSAGLTLELASGASSASLDAESISLTTTGGTVPGDIGLTAVGIDLTATSGGITLAGSPIQLNGALVKVNGAQVMPPGIIQMYGGAGLPTGWLVCDGSAVSRTTYASLFAAIGTTYGAGNGSTTFNLPDFTNAFPRGNSAAVNGGAATHTHSFDDGGHTHPLGDNGQAQVNAPATNSISVRRVATASFAGDRQLTGTAQTASTGQTFGAALAGNTNSAHAAGTTGSSSSLPPYTGVTFIIKT